MTAYACIKRQDLARKSLKLSPSDPDWINCKDCPDAANPKEAKAMTETKSEPTATPPADEPKAVAPLCPRCQERPIKIRADGRSMGRCDACLADDHEAMRTTRRAKTAARREAAAATRAAKAPPPPTALDGLGQALRARCDSLRVEARHTVNDRLRTTIIETLALIEITAALGLLPGYGPTPEEPTS